MNSLVLLCGPVHRPLRVQTLQAAGARVISLIPSSLPADPEAISVDIPAAWLPEDPDMTIHQKTWHKADALPLAAIAAADLRADFYWIIESDCAAPTERWAALFSDWEQDPADGVFFRPQSRLMTAWNPWWESTPAWAGWTHLNAIYRLSAAAVQASIAAAEEMRNVFCEMTCASVLQRAGLTIGSLNARQTHANCQTMKAKPEAVILNRRLINHPVKEDSFGLDGIRSRWDRPAPALTPPGEV